MPRELRMIPVKLDLDQSPGVSVLLLGGEFRAPERLESLQRDLEMFGLDSLCVANVPEVARLSLMRELKRAGDSCERVERCELVVVALNLCPRPPGPRTRARLPGLDDDVPYRLRKRLLACDSPGSSCWVSHSTPSAWKCIATMMPDMLDALSVRIADLRCRFQTPFPVIAPLGGYSANAKAELVTFRGQPAVCKLFKPGRDRFFQRELIAATQLSALIEEIPPLLASGENWLVFPYYGDADKYSPDGIRLLSLPQARRVGKLIEKLHEAGFAHMDLGYGNILFRPDGDVVLLDFEYLYRYHGCRPPVTDSFDVAGPPPRFDGDLPKECRHGPRSYANLLMPGTGLSFQSLLHDPAWKQHLARLRYLMNVKLPRYVIGVLRARAKTTWMTLRVWRRSLHQKPVRPALS